MTTVTLDYPIMVGGDRVERLEVRRANVGDLEAAEAAGPGRVAMTRVLISRLTGLLPGEAQSIDAADFGKLGREVAGFLPRPEPGAGA